MEKTRSVDRAKMAKKDEFYTQLTDIEKELRHYRQHFRGKTILCNCDDPFESNFFKYFVLNFNRLGLKKLIATCYAGSPIANQQLSIFDVLGISKDTKDRPYKAVVTTIYDKTGDGGVGMLDVAELFKSGENELTELVGDGDFRSPECLALLDEADIVVTNPPFSLFREYVATLVEHNKHFIIIGNKNAVAYKEFFPLLMQNKVWVGTRSMNQDFWMYVPKGEPYEKLNEENKPIKHIMACWYTNLDIKKRHEEMIPVRRYNKESYPKYVNYDAINVDKVVDIPMDYKGTMGVPVTFLDKYNPDQFEIIGLGIANLGLSIGVKPYEEEHKAYRKNVQHRGTVDGDLYMLDEKGHPVVPYARILIRNKKPELTKED